MQRYTKSVSFLSLCFPCLYLMYSLRVHNYVRSWRECNFVVGSKCDPKKRLYGVVNVFGKRYDIVKRAGLMVVNVCFSLCGGRNLFTKSRRICLGVCNFGYFHWHHCCICSWFMWNLRSAILWLTVWNLVDYGVVQIMINVSYGKTCISHEISLRVYRGIIANTFSAEFYCVICI